MCDTLVAVGNATASGAVLFAKNSDRDPNEAQALVRVPRTVHEAGSPLKCTYISIPQVAETYEILLSKPFWMWGSEMGTNEYGLTIGNEAVFARIPFEKKPGLIGMDLLRLALERARTAREGLDVITTLLAAYGQSGSGGYEHKFFYYNSFILADPSEAWVLETAGREWVAERVKDVRSISNRLTIGSTWDLASDNLVQYAIDRGWCKSRDDFHFAHCYSDLFYSTFSFARGRHNCTTEALTSRKGQLTIEDMIAALRGHGPSSPSDDSFSPAYGIARTFVCQHAGWGPLRDYQATGSLASQLTPDVQTHFVTGTSAPCTSIFKPVWLGAGLPDIGPEPRAAFDGKSLWWRHEALHRAVLRNYPENLKLYAEDRDALEKRFIDEALASQQAPIEERQQVMARAFDEASRAEAEWLLERVRKSNRPSRQGWLYAQAWRTRNRRVRMP